MSHSCAQTLPEAQKHTEMNMLFIFVHYYIITKN